MLELEQKLEKMAGFQNNFCQSISQSLQIQFNQSQNISPYCSIVWWWLQVKSRWFADVSDKETQGHIYSDLSCFTHIRNTSRYN